MKKTTKRLALAGSSLVVALLVATGCQSSMKGGGNYGQGSVGADAMYPPAPTRESQAAMSPQEALAQLRAGNARFVAGKTEVRNLAAKVRATASGQYPFAVILSCLDSRQPTEIVFDQGIGNVFCARAAGNVLTEDLLGSMEFGCRVAGAKPIVVVGHSNCGAIKGTIDDVQLDHLTGLLARIKPAIARVPAEVQPRTSGNDDFVQKVAEAFCKPRNYLHADIRRVFHQVKKCPALDQYCFGIIFNCHCIGSAGCIPRYKR